MDNYIVRLRECGSCIGSGVLYYDESLGNETYVITAAHCLYKKPEQFREVRQSISVDIVNPADGAFKTIDVAVNAGNAVYGTGRDCDYAVLVLDRAKVENILCTLPRVSVIPSGVFYYDEDRAFCGCMKMYYR